MKKSDKKTSPREALTPMLQLAVPLADVVRHELREFVIGQGMAALVQTLEEDRAELCGEPYERGRSDPRRGGNCSGRTRDGRPSRSHSPATCARRAGRSDAADVGDVYVGRSA